jgi:phosphatidate phosphatase LPIN
MFEINNATLSGAIDIIVIKYPNGTYKSSPFHVRFGVFKIVNSKGKNVTI